LDKSRDVSNQPSPEPAIGYWAAQEQYSMEKLLEFTIDAERKGFTTIMTSDHFHPWWHDDACGNFTWIWIAVAAERTKKMHFVTGVTAPIYRYHPAIIAQAFASLNRLFPGRIGLGIGSGEALNEVPLGFDWPNAKARLMRAKEAMEVIKKLWVAGKSAEKNNDNKDFVSYNGEYFLIRNARLYTPPKTNIPLYMAATGKHSVQIAAKHADGLITYLKPEEAKDSLSLFNETVRKQGRDPSSFPKIAEYKVSYSEDYDQALQSANFWRGTLVKNVFNSAISNPQKLEQKAKKEVSDEQLKKGIDITTSIEECIRSIEQYFKVGFTRVYIHSTSPDEMGFLDMFSKRVLPHFSKNLE
jgi:coenzyme F420-dependent glucose-6-phosphate dehydrogenase